MKRLTALMAVAAALAVVGGVAAADSGPLAPPPEHDTYYTWPGAQTLQVSVEPWGGGFVQNVPKYFIDCPFACIRPFDTGATVTLTATPTTGYTFVGWKVADHAQPATAGACPGDGDVHGDDERLEGRGCCVRRPTQAAGWHQRTPRQRGAAASGLAVRCEGG